MHGQARLGRIQSDRTQMRPTGDMPHANELATGAINPKFRVRFT
jgi:hypothetical protein